MTAAVSTTTSIKSTTLASGTALSHASTEISNADSSGKSLVDSSTRVSLSDSITETSFSDVSSVTPSTVANSQSLGLTALPISETDEDLLDYGNSNSGINFLDQLLYDTGIFDRNYRFLTLLLNFYWQYFFLGVVDNDDTPSSSRLELLINLYNKALRSYIYAY